MFEMFGEMETAEEINAVARSLKEEGERENLDKLCAENGIDAELAEMFWDGEIDFVTDQLMAAVGKLDMEVKEAKGQNGYLESIANFLKAEAEKDKDLAIAIRKKGKKLTDSYKAVENEARKRKKSGSNCVVMRDKDVFEIVEKYYKEGARA
jgi:hypothetical protein|uniref:PcfK-like protein n=1 Tax=Myoviridae sp. ctzwE5 TaxID=2825214 RepID=A0A8S5PVX0_9CAUD|nr:MAG TPA: PcfK-like protein [Myoviridae sp. ctzwE5]